MQHIATYGVYLSTDSKSAPLSIGTCWLKAQEQANMLNATMGAGRNELFYVDGILSRGEIPAEGYYRDADNVTMVREVSLHIDAALVADPYYTDDI